MCTSNLQPDALVLTQASTPELPWRRRAPCPRVPCIDEDAYCGDCLGQWGAISVSLRNSYLPIHNLLASWHQITNRNVERLRALEDRCRIEARVSLMREVAQCG